MSVANMVTNQVPFLDLVSPHIELEQELTGVFRNALATAGFIGGAVVDDFEQAFAEFCDADYCIAVGSGTDALRFAIMACGIMPGEVVLTVPHTFIATTEAISQAGCLAEFIDIDEQTYNMSVESLRRFLENDCTRGESGNLVSARSGRQVTAIVPVHLYGQMADMDAILAIADEFNLTVIEDACQAHGARYFSKRLGRWMTAGSMGRAAAFSFYPGKNLGACGEAGAVTSNDQAVAKRIKMLRDHGQVKKYYHDCEGYNGRLDAIQAGILKAKLAHLSRWNEQRRERAAEYEHLLAGVEGISLPFEPNWSQAVYHLYVIRTDRRDEMITHFNEAGIGWGIHYPIPLHLQKAYAHLDYRRGDFPAAERAAAEILSLPIYPQLTSEQQTTVAEEIFAFSATTSFKPKEAGQIAQVSARHSA